MSSIFRVGVCRFVTNSKSLLSAANVGALQKCSISGKELRASRGHVNKPAPYDYKNKRYGFLNALFDKTTHRFDDNTKLIAIEGLVGVGRSDFAKKLAQELDMLYLPPVTMDNFYINSYGFDMRQLDSKVPESCRSFDINNFHADPNHPNAAFFQIMMYRLRYAQYIDALEHILSTGQGVIVNRTPHSDFIFLEAMFKQGYISKGARSVYYEIRETTIPELLRPHLVVYLDVSVQTALNNIKKRNNPTEATSKVYTPDYLETLNTEYKKKYLKEISEHSELLVYDWTNGGDIEIAVEDMERIDFGCYEKQDSKLSDWRHPKEWDWAEVRYQFTTNKQELMDYFNIPRYDVPELITDGYDCWKYKEIWENAPGNKFRPGYNAEMGDKGLLTKF